MAGGTVPTDRSVLAAFLASICACQPPLVEAPTGVVPPPDGTGPLPTGDDDDDDLVGDDDDDAEPIRLDGVAPGHGTAGHQVLIDGGPFPADVVVRIDGVSAPILDLRANRLLVEVPDLGPDGEVQITVASGAAPSADTLAFRYFEDGTGRIGAIGLVEFGTHRGGYWADSVLDDGFANVIFTQPTDYGWEHLIYGPGPDTCQREWVLGETIYAQEPGVPSIGLTNGDSDLLLVGTADLPWDYETGAVPTEPGSGYDLRPMVGNPAWPAFEVPGMTGVIPEAFQVLSPDIDAVDIPPVQPALPLAWGGPHDGDLVLVWLVRERWDGTDYVPLESVSCWLVDDGAHLVPDLWDDWDEDVDYVYFALGRVYRPQGAILPHNNARSEVLGVHWAVGFLDAN